MHHDNEWKDILILAEGPTYWLEDTTLTAEAKYPTKISKYPILILHNQIKVLYLLMLQKYINTKVKALK